MKKALSIILAIVMLFGCMSITAFAAEDDCKTCGGTGKAAPAEEQKEILPFSQYQHGLL